MNFLLDYGFDEEEIKVFSANIPPLLHEHILNYYLLIKRNIDYLKEIGIENYKEIFTKFYDMFLMDKSNFVNIFNKYDREDLVEKINKSADVVEYLQFLSFLAMDPKKML